MLVETGIADPGASPGTSPNWRVVQRLGRHTNSFVARQRAEGLSFVCMVCVGRQRLNEISYCEESRKLLGLLSQHECIRNHEANAGIQLTTIQDSETHTVLQDSDIHGTTGLGHTHGTTGLGHTQQYRTRTYHSIPRGRRFSGYQLSGPPMKSASWRAENRCRVNQAALSRETTQANANRDLAAAPDAWLCLLACLDA